MTDGVVGAKVFGKTPSLGVRFSFRRATFPKRKTETRKVTLTSITYIAAVWRNNLIIKCTAVNF
jgi:hypothetical protein